MRPRQFPPGGNITGGGGALEVRITIGFSNSLGFAPPVKREAASKTVISKGPRDLVEKTNRPRLSVKVLAINVGGALIPAHSTLLGNDTGFSLTNVTVARLTGDRDFASNTTPKTSTVAPTSAIAVIGLPVLATSIASVVTIIRRAEILCRSHVGRYCCDLSKSLCLRSNYC